MARFRRGRFSRRRRVVRRRGSVSRRRRAPRIGYRM